MLLPEIIFNCYCYTCYSRGWGFPILLLKVALGEVGSYVLTLDVKLGGWLGCEWLPMLPWYIIEFIYFKQNTVYTNRLFLLHTGLNIGVH